MTKHDKEILETALVGFQLEIDRIHAAMAGIRAQLNGASAPQSKDGAARPKRKMSAAARKRIAAAQRKRWAKARKAMK